jgi:hypothetical protein
VKKVLILGLLVLLCACVQRPKSEVHSATNAPPSNSDQELERECMELMEVTKLDAPLENMKEQLFDIIEKGYPQVPAEVWVKMRAEFKISEIKQIAAQVYAKHFTKAEIDELLGFYKTPLGQKLLAEQPAMYQELAAAGQEYGKSVATKVIAQLEKEGYFKKKPAA